MTRSRPRVAIAHDSLTQRGGAERVVLAMTRAFPEAQVHTTLFDPARTYPEFGDVDVVPSVANRVGVLRRHARWALPVLAPVLSHTRIQADVVLVSSSGWAHGYDIPGRSVVYCHTPPHWLHQRSSYLGDSSLLSPARLGLLVLHRPLVRWDRAAAQRHDTYLCNSREVRRQISRVYDIDAAVVPPPSGLDPCGDQEVVADVADVVSPGYDLVVSRLLPYKNVDVAIEAARRTGRPLVVVGDGPERERLRRDLPPHVVTVRALSDAQLRWTYAHSGVLIATSREDYGLTPVEAAGFGVPTVAWRAGGYLDTVVEGRTGVFFDRADPRRLADALGRADQTTWDPEAIRAHAAEFSVSRFAERLQAEVESLLGR